jgi:site-specific DNA-cytosine methylase
MQMKILIACEESQAVTKEFRALGHSAWSCDIEPCSGGHPEWHLQCNVEEILDEQWDMIIAHPPCTHLSVSGARYFAEKRADGRQQAAIKFFMMFVHHPCSKICIENPVGIMSSMWRKPDQIIQPWMFGEDASKATCLWLKGLPVLSPTEIIRKERYANQTASGQNKLGPSPERARLRSKTYEGVARAMAEQWGKL